MNTEELIEAIEQEWRNMYHNASISRHCPDFRNEYECSLFWDCLGSFVGMWCDDLSDWLNEKYGIRLTFYQYGRNGATVAPSEWMSAIGGGDFGTFKHYPTLDDSGGLEAYNYNRKILKIMREINRYWTDTAAYIPEWWQDIVEANGYQANIEAHDGMTQKTVTVWA